MFVEGGFILISLRFRHRKGRERTPAQTHGNTRLEIGWTIAPALVLAVVMVPTVAMIWELDVRDPEAMQVTVKGYQWWWGFEYADEDMTTSYGDQDPIMTADVLVIPEDTPVELTLVSAGGGAHDDAGVPDFEVNHSFWVPRLFGKQDAIPMNENHILFSADEPGTYWGQCAEFCGLQHTKMKFRVVVLDQAAWERWVARAQAAGASSRPTRWPPRGWTCSSRGLRGRAVHRLPHDRRDGRRGDRRAEPDALRGPDPRMFRGLRLGDLRRRAAEPGGTEGVAPRPRRGEAGREDARLRPDRGRDRRDRGLPVQLDVRREVTRWRA